MVAELKEKREGEGPGCLEKRFFMLTVSREWDRVWWSAGLLSTLLEIARMGGGESVGAVPGRFERWPDGHL